MACFRARGLVTEIIVKGVGVVAAVFGRRGVGKMFFQVAQNLFRHGHCAVKASQEITRKRSVVEVFFVGNDVVSDGNDAGVAVLLDLSGESAKTGREKRHPIAENDEIGGDFGVFLAREQPIQGIDAVELNVNAEVIGNGVVAVLAFPGKQEIGVLQRKGEQRDLMLFLKFTRQALVVGG